MTKEIRVPQLVAAARTVQGLYTTEFIHATATVTSVKDTRLPIDPDPEWTISFEIEGFGHGRAIFVYDFGRLRLRTLLQYTGPGIAYTEFYRSRHGNEELVTLMNPLLEAKLRPVVLAVL